MLKVVFLPLGQPKEKGIFENLNYKMNNKDDITLLNK